MLHHERDSGERQPDSSISMALARVNMASGISSKQRDFAYGSLPANLHLYPFKPIMNFTYRISAVADTLRMTPGTRFRVERRNGINIAAPMLLVR
ncbi:MAG: hypothetical protein ABI642_01175 [Polaromonas sp.]